MSAVDPAGEWRELAERYHRMLDPELVVLARQKNTLTDLAQHALTQEIAYRGLIIPGEGDLAEPEPEPDSPETDDPYFEERKLVEIRKVYSLADARQLEWLLNRAGIPFYLGEIKARAVDGVAWDFSRGVSVKIMRIGWYWASQALRNYSPSHEPESEVVEADDQDVAMQCPRCRGTEVVLAQMVSESHATFEWTCDSCGYSWADDGTVK